MLPANSKSILKGPSWRDRRWTPAVHNWGANAAAVVVRLKALAPYALLELVLPGGSVMALLLWLYRRRKNGIDLGRLPGGLLAFLRALGADYRAYRGRVAMFVPRFEAKKMAN